MPCCTKVLGKIQAKHIEEDDLGKAKQFRLFSIARPYMRSFHSSWFCFFIAFTSWFGLQPLLPTIGKELKLSKTDLANSGIASVAATVAVRVIIGPMCDKYGPRKTMSCLLISGAVPMALAGLIKSGTGLIILRLFVGILGGTFVPCQFWTTAMFSSKIVGTANAIAAGWGNLGGGFTFILMPGLFRLMEVFGADEFLAWKIAVVIPSVICVLIGILILFTSDDCPQGHWENRTLPPSAKLPGKKKDETQGVANLGYKNDSKTVEMPKEGKISKYFFSRHDHIQHALRGKNAGCSTDFWKIKAIHIEEILEKQNNLDYSALLVYTCKVIMLSSYDTVVRSLRIAYFGIIDKYITSRLANTGNQVTNLSTSN